jgi:hypothetical protein
MLAGIAASGLLALTLAGIPNAGLASSHREAPLISKDPGADNTDLYAFVSPDKPDTVTIIANYIPLEEPAGGPNFNAFDDDALYSIHIDNDGDSKDDITYNFDFNTKIRNPNTFLYNVGPISSLNDKNWNMPQSYDVTRVHDGKSRRIGHDIPTPPVNVGPRSTPNYEALAAAAVKKIDGNIMVFAGQRDDSFFVDLGSIFDLGGLRPFNNAHVIPLDPAAGEDEVSGYNTHAIAIQIPIDQLTHDGKKADKTKMPVLGIYASASRMSRRVLRDDGTVDNSGKYVQVSRLGNPLINEVIIPLGGKDYWNAQDPSKDKQFQKYYETPELAGLINFLYPGLPDTRTSGRTDLSLILLTGVPGLNFTGNTAADLLRLNVALKPNANGACYAVDPKPSDQPDPLGVLNADLCGFPNGRRLADDVTDIELRAVADGYGSFLNTNFSLPNLSPNNLVGDGANENDLPNLSSFPYQGTPHQGYEHVDHKVGSASTPPIK